MKNRKFWRILLGVVVAIVVLGAVGFGFYRRSMWGGHFGAMGKMPYDYDGDMPCDEDGEALCEGKGYGTMPCGGFRGMGRMPHMGRMGGMHGGWGRRGHSPLTGLLFLVLVVLGVMHFNRRHMYHKLYHQTPMHMHPGHHDGADACCCGEGPEHADKTPAGDVNQPESE